MFFSVILLSAALRLASATPMLRAQTTCSPLESTGVSLIGQGGAQASVPVHTVDSVVWVPTDAGFAPDVAPWSFVKSGSSFVIKFVLTTPDRASSSHTFSGTRTIPMVC